MEKEKLKDTLRNVILEKSKDIRKFQKEAKSTKEDLERAKVRHIISLENVTKEKTILQHDLITQTAEVALLKSNETRLLKELSEATENIKGLEEELQKRQKDACEGKEIEAVLETLEEVKTKLDLQRGVNNLLEKQQNEWMDVLGVPES